MTEINIKEIPAKEELKRLVALLEDKEYMGLYKKFAKLQMKLAQEVLNSLDD